MRYRLRWSKTGKLRFLSHHDEALVFERSARRAGLPLAYSKGYSPHPKIAFGSGLPVGYASSVELLDAELTEELDPAELVDSYNRGLPPGLRIEAGAALHGKPTSLGAAIVAADYQVGLEADWLSESLRRFMSLDSYEVSRPYKGGMRKDDLRVGVLSAEEIDTGLRMRCAIKPRSTRPSDVVMALAEIAGATRTNARYERIALLAERDGLRPIDERWGSEVKR